MTQNNKKVMPFGKYKGKELKDVPNEYVAWLLKDGELSEELKHNLEIMLLVKHRENFINHFIKSYYRKRHNYSSYSSAALNHGPTELMDAMSYCLPNSY